MMITDDFTFNVTDDVTGDLTKLNDLVRARHISDLIVSCCQMNSAGNVTNQIAFMVALNSESSNYSNFDITGSCAELYIVPGETCIGDIDLMFPMTDHIVVCDGSVVDSIDVDETINVYQIETSDCPNGYVYMRQYGKLQFNWETEQFEYLVFSHTVYSMPYFKLDNSMFHGPAQVGECILKKLDFVPYARLLAWPSVAQSWISRDRNYARPSNAIVSEVQRNGCDLVHVSHRDYKHDIGQWRYSFSRAEVILIRSWTQVQQLVYHMLRYFTKHAIIREGKDDDEVVCNYHIKTLMLWACERKSPVWWESNCVLGLSSKLLGTLMKWIGKKMCPHYFIPEWNLFDFTMKESRRLDTIETLRIHTNMRTLSEWFRINYLSKVLKFENPEHQHVLDTIAESNRFNKYFQAVLQKWVVEGSGGFISCAYDKATILHHIDLDWNARRFRMLIHSKNLAPELQFLNLAVVSLRLAWNISGMRESELSNHELLDVLSEVVLKLSGHDTWNSSTPYNISFKQCSKWYFIKGVRLLSIHCKKQSAAYCIWVKACKRYFKSALRIQDGYSESIHDACHVYLSALYYVSGANHEKTTQHSLEARNGTSYRGFSKPHIVIYSSLVFIDTVAHVSGFCFLFDHVLQNHHALSENGFTLSAIVHCLILLVSQINKSNLLNKLDRKEMTKYKFTSLFDICLWAVSVHKYRRSTHNGDRNFHKWPLNIPNISSNNEEEMQFCLEESLEETLMKISIGMFEKYLDLQCITLTQIGFPYGYKIVSHFKALYYYRKGEYTKLLNTCVSIISQETVLFSEERNHPMCCFDQCHQDVHCVSVLFAFQTLFRNDVTCLTGLIALIDPRCFGAIRDEDFIEKVRNYHFNSLTEMKYAQGKLKGFHMIFYMSRISRLFLVYYLRLQSLIQLHFPKRDLLPALNDLKHANVGLLFEDVLLLFVVKTLERMKR